MRRPSHEVDAADGVDRRRGPAADAAARIGSALATVAWADGDDLPAEGHRLASGDGDAGSPPSMVDSVEAGGGIVPAGAATPTGVARTSLRVAWAVAARDLVDKCLIDRDGARKRTQRLTLWSDPSL